MKNTSKLDVALKTAFDGYRQDWCAALPNGGAVTLTPATQTKMQKAVRRRARVYYPLFGTTARRVASVVLALALSLSMVVVNVDSLLPGRARMVVTQVDDFEYEVTFAYKGEIPAYSFVKKYPSYLPAGYHTDSTLPPSFRNAVAIDYYGLGGHISYSQSSLYYENLCGNPIEVTLSTFGRDISHIFINDKRAVIASSKTTTTLVFCDDEYVYRLSGSNSIPWSEYIKMAESIS